MRYRVYIIKYDHKELIAKFEYEHDAVRFIKMCNKTYGTPSPSLRFELEYEDE